MQIKTNEQYHLGPDALIEEEVFAALSALPPSRRVHNPSVLSYWLGQLVGWPGHDFFSVDMPLADKKRYVMAQVLGHAQSSELLKQMDQSDSGAGNLWPLLADCFSGAKAAAGEAYLKQLSVELSLLPKPSCFDRAQQPSKSGRQTCDLFALVPIRIVCAYLIHIEGYAPPAASSNENRTEMLEVTRTGADKTALRRPSPFPRQHAGNLALTVLNVIGLSTSADIDSLIRQVLKEPWVTAGPDFSFWQLLPDVASPANDR